MANLGYYETPKGPASLVQKEAGIELAIKRMQRFAGISETG